jgi:hypothetical protein
VPRHRRAERHGHEDHREQRDPGQRQRPAQRPREHVGDRATARGASEIAARETVETVPEARAGALVQPELGGAAATAAGDAPRSTRPLVASPGSASVRRKTAAATIA